jgi:16S rRNA (cytidine1402-2'-O)-methyltransferase
MPQGKLYLIPTVISENTQHAVIPAHVLNALQNIRHFLAEDIRTARRYLSSLKIFESIEALSFQQLNKDTPETELEELFGPIKSGLSLGVLSESGCPGVADPGAMAVRYAHTHNIPVVPLVGPSSILLALMASGLNGQHFAFHGYLPIDTKECARAIKELEKESRQKNQTQIFIETPYRNNQVFGQLVKNLADTTYLTVATDLTGIQETIKTLTVRTWKRHSLTFEKLPTVFLFLA